MTAARVLVACEFSGTVRDAFLARGFDAWSCDLLPDERGSNRHIRGDVREHLGDGWDLLIVAHLYSRTPPTHVLQFVERVAMLEGRLVQIGSVDPFAEKPGSKVSTATAYCWLVWLHKHAGAATKMRWIAPCRHRLERAGDYPVYERPSLDFARDDRGAAGALL